MLVRFWIPTAVFRLRIPDSTSKIFYDSGFYRQKFPRFRNPDSLTWGDDRSERKPYCLQKVEIKFILMLLLCSALARFVVGVFLISQLHAWTTFCLFCYISDHKVCFRQYVRRVSHISLVNSEYGHLQVRSGLKCSSGASS